MVDELAADRSQAAIDAVNELAVAVGQTKNDELAAAGRRFHESLLTDVDRFELTVDQAAELGQQYMNEASVALGGMIDACAGAGAAIERLPSS